jgi:ADP-ribose pyrophosphatase YjhB (NUDIX family)
MTAAPPPAVVRPVVAVLAVPVREHRVLLVKRANPPDQGKWGFPGGRIELGETVSAAALRELAEETGVAAEALDVLTVLDIIDRDAAGALRFHYVLIAVLCRWRAGEPVAADDALEAGWFGLDDLKRPGLVTSAAVERITRLALARLAPP